MSHSEENTCCLPVDTALWENITHVWNEKPFIGESIPLIFHIPMPWMIKKVVGRLWGQAQEAGAAPEMKDFLMLAHDPSPWKGEYLLAVNKDVPGANNIKLSGTYISKVFDGPFNAIPKYIKEMDSFLKTLDKVARYYYFYYTTCPKCAKKFGHNYIIAFAQL
ncbi:MAG: hypothetical protein K9H64_20560 [Bacteroidales bacterium]|nr:hypothetical protein [Bacteroidales bacterium]MCF8458438.1 hypothetical protein [Bacteroidales bacterium]